MCFKPLPARRRDSGNLPHGSPVEAVEHPRPLKTAKDGAVFFVPHTAKAGLAPTALSCAKLFDGNSWAVRTLHPVDLKFLQTSRTVGSHELTARMR